MCSPLGRWGRAPSPSPRTGGGLGTPVRTAVRLRQEGVAVAVLDLYAQVRGGKRVRDDDTNRLVSILKLSGATRVVEGVLCLRNRIYERVFDHEWVRQPMPDAELRRQRAAYRRGLLRAVAGAAVIVSMMGALTFRAVQFERRATSAELREREGRLQSERLLYGSDMQVAHQDWETGNTGRMLRLLNDHRPKPGAEDRRGWEWFYLWRLLHGYRLALWGNEGGVTLWDLATGGATRGYSGAPTKWVDGSARVGRESSGRRAAGPAPGSHQTGERWRSGARMDGSPSGIRQPAGGSGRGPFGALPSGMRSSPRRSRPTAAGWRRAAGRLTVRDASGCWRWRRGGLRGPSQWQGTR